MVQLDIKRPKKVALNSFSRQALWTFRLEEKSSESIVEIVLYLIPRMPYSSLNFSTYI